ncbi:hypothetical protein MTBLM1_80032 [Rhodospirillaceae bacterium LM-1]|nr:hypothetical protein MTBLM1_80032 [Rhodospirillaceae bacterium LM-1]
MNALPRTSPFIVRQAEPCWRMTATALVGQSEIGRVAYGRWDHQFGAWVEQDGDWLPFCPSIPFLGKFGVWLEPKGERTDRWYEERAMKAAYFNLIPTFVRRLASAHGRKQWQWLQAYWNTHASANSSKEMQNG